MTQWHGKSNRKETGGRRWPARKKKRGELGRDPIHARLGEQKRRIFRTRGGNQKIRIHFDQKINVTDPATGKTTPTKIKTVLQNQADLHLVRANILTRGAVVDTEIGKAIITSRPGQNGVLNGLMVKKE
jgi:small subunit ribosomal protein S8e